MKSIVLLCVLCGFFLVGCGEKEKPSVDGDDQDVLISFSTNAMPTDVMQNMVLKSTKSTDENLISMIILFGLDDKGMVVKALPISNPTLTGITITMPIEVKTLYAVANPTPGIEGALIPTLANLLNLTGDYTSAPQSPFLLSGKGDIVGSNATIRLDRAIVKIEVVSLNELQIKSVTVKNTPNRIYIFKKETTTPPSSIRVIYPANTTNSIVYVAECSKDNPVELEVTGTYLGKTVSNTIILTKGGSPIDAVRNTCYRVGVSATSEPEWTYTITITDWDEENADRYVIPSENFES